MDQEDSFGFFCVCCIILYMYIIHILGHINLYECYQHNFREKQYFELCVASL